LLFFYLEERANL